MQIKKLQVDGMKCSKCAQKVESALQKIDGIEGVKIDLDSKIVEITYNDNIDLDIIKESILDLGYDVA